MPWSGAADGNKAASGLQQRCGLDRRHRRWRFLLWQHRHRGHEPEALARHGLDVAAALGVVSQRPALGGHQLARPQGQQQDVLGQQFTRLLDKQQQRAEDARRLVELRAVKVAHAVQRALKHEVA